MAETPVRTPVDITPLRDRFMPEYPHISDFFYRLLNNLANAALTPTSRISPIGLMVFYHATIAEALNDRNIADYLPDLSRKSSDCGPLDVLEGFAYNLLNQQIRTTSYEKTGRTVPLHEILAILPDDIGEAVRAFGTRFPLKMTPTLVEITGYTLKREPAETRPVP